MKDNNTIDLLLNSKLVGVPRVGPGDSYMGLSLGPYSLTANGQKMKKGYGRALIKGPADDVMPRNYEACDICRGFDDTVCIMAPTTVVYGNGGCWSHYHLTAKLG